MKSKVRVEVTFNNPGTPACVVEAPIGRAIGVWMDMACYLESFGVRHPESGHVYILDSVRKLEVLEIITGE